MSKELFAKLASAAPSVVPRDGTQWIQRASEDDAKFLAKAEVESIRLGRHLGASFMSNASNRYVAIVGMTSDDLMIDGLEPCEPTPALFQLTVLDLNIDPSASESELREVLQSETSQDENYEGHNLEQVMNLFPTLRFFNVEENVDKHLTDISRILGLAICLTGISLPLDLSEKNRNAYVEIFESSPDSYPIILALQGLLAAFWQTQFIELYRTVEQLFPAIAVKSLSDRIGFGGSNLQLNSHISETLGWRPKEDGALENLVRTLSGETLELYRQAFAISSDESDIASLVSRSLYRLRNSIVHYRGPNSLSKISVLDWQKIIEATCRFSHHAYTMYGRSYFHTEMLVPSSKDV